MKKALVIIAVLGILGAPVVFAKGESVGCGLGSMVFSGQKGMIPNILAATTNGISANQTFGITSGTLGCSADATVLREQEQQVFVVNNLDNLTQDLAQGHGQYLDALAGLMGCPTSAAPELGRMTQEQYRTLVPAGTDGATLLTNIKQEMAARPALASACTRLS